MVFLGALNRLMKTNNFFTTLPIHTTNARQGGHYGGQTKLPGRNKAAVAEQPATKNSYTEDFATALRREFAATPALLPPVSQQENLRAETRAIQFLKEFWA